MRFFIDGTWTGRIKCKGVNGGVKEKLTLPATMRVTQDGLTVGLEVDLGGGQITSYTGVANPDAAKPDKKGELAIIRCRTDDQAARERSRTAEEQPLILQDWRCLHTVCHRNPLTDSIFYTNTRSTRSIE